MNDLVVIAATAWLAGIAAFAGGTIAHFEGSVESEQKQEIIHGIVAFGGGILLAAVAFALTPTGIAELPTPLLAVSFIAGGLVFCGLDACIMTAAGGGILYLVFQDIAPQAKLKRHWAPPLGAVLGFGLGVVGHQLLG